MANIFLQLTEFRFKRETIQEITNAETNKKAQAAIQAFYSSGKTTLADYANFLIDLLPLTSAKQSKQKLLIALVYFIVKMDQNTSLKCLERILILNEPVLLKVKIFSYIFKSTNSTELKKWLIKKTVAIIQNEQKVSSFAGLIDHFDEIVGSLNLSEQQTFEIYFKLISYLEKHPVYKKLCSIYVIRSLQKVTEKIAQTKQTSQLIIKTIRSGVISQSALTLLNHAALKKNELYPILQVLLTGDFQKLDSHLASIKKLQSEGLLAQDVLRKMKIQSIPRLLSNVKNVSYEQVAERLKIKKGEVESYIIDAIKQGILKAKLDEFQQTVIINSVNYRALRLDERAKLQKDITDLCEQLRNNLKLAGQA